MAAHSPRAPPSSTATQRGDGPRRVREGEDLVHGGAEDMENGVIKEFSFHESLELYRKCIPEFVDDLMKLRQLDSIFVVGASSLSDKLTDR